MMRPRNTDGVGVLPNSQFAFKGHRGSSSNSSAWLQSYERPSSPYDAMRETSFSDTDDAFHGGMYYPQSGAPGMGTGYLDFSPAGEWAAQPQQAWGASTMSSQAFNQWGSSTMTSPQFNQWGEAQGGGGAYVSQMPWNAMPADQSPGIVVLPSNGQRISAAATLPKTPAAEPTPTKSSRGALPPPPADPQPSTRGALPPPPSESQAKTRGAPPPLPMDDPAVSVAPAQPVYGNDPVPTFSIMPAQPFYGNDPPPPTSRYDPMLPASYSVKKR